MGLHCDQLQAALDSRFSLLQITVREGTLRRVQQQTSLTGGHGHSHRQASGSAAPLAPAGSVGAAGKAPVGAAAAPTAAAAGGPHQQQEQQQAHAPRHNASAASGEASKLGATPPQRGTWARAWSRGAQRARAGWSHAWQAERCGGRAGGWVGARLPLALAVI